MSSFFSTGSSSTAATAAAAAASQEPPAPGRGSTTSASAAHYHVIHSMILPSTEKIKKELQNPLQRGRYKDVSAKLSDAISMLQQFQNESWSPPNDGGGGGDDDDNNDNNNNNNGNTTNNGTTTAAAAAAAEPANQISLEADFKADFDNDSSTLNTDDDEDVDSTFGDFTEAIIKPDDDDDGFKAFEEAQQPAEVDAKAINNTSSIPLDSKGVEDDPQTREAMHESIRVALDAYIMAMKHTYTTNKACEHSLECVKQLVMRNYVSRRAGGRDDPTGSGPAAMAKKKNGSALSEVEQTDSQLHQLLEAIEICAKSDKCTESVSSHIIECVKEVLTSRKCGIHEGTMMMGVRSIFHIYLVTKSDTNREAAKTALEDFVEYQLRRLEEAAVVPQGSLDAHEQSELQHRQSLWYKDSDALMASLVRLSAKILPEDSENSNPSNFSFASQIFSPSSDDPIALKNKVLSLELILRAMECAGPRFCNDDNLIELVQSELCVALLKNCVSNNTSVAFISNQIFLILVYKFKSHLKEEIQTFMSNIFLRVLESENSSFQQKALVLESLRSMCKDPVLLSQIFLNYDCDKDAMNLYKDIVFHLTKLSGKSTMMQFTNPNMSKRDAEEHQKLSLDGNEVLVTILQSFMNALGMTTTSSEMNDTAGKQIRKSLNIESVSTPRRSSSRKSLSQKKKSSVLSQNGEGEKVVVMDENNEEVVLTLAEDPKRKGCVQSAGSSRPTDAAGKVNEAFKEKQKKQEDFELGAVKFTLDLKKGLNFFIDNDFVKCDAKEIARFFLDRKDELDKTQMGEVLGREPDSAFIKKPPDLDPEKGGHGFFVRILHHYIHFMDFTGMEFDEAIRTFLSGFRLPGEAQKIDRIMEKFAERFTLQNPEVFPSADTAFILAFSVIMLNTDLHNPSIKEERRMTLDSFLRNNRGIGENGSDLNEEFLSGIFARIKAQPFSLKEDDAAREKASETIESSVNLLGDNGGYLGAGLFGTSTEERKKEKFQKEREEMMAVTEKLFKARKERSTKAASTLDGVDPADVVVSMFDVTWGPVIGILSQVLECSNDERSIAVCLNGFVYAIRISSHTKQSLARETFVNSLAKFTYLGSIKEMKPKNIESIRTLMNIAITDGDYLGEGWGSVLQCISQISRMRIAASGLDSDESFLQDGTKTAKKKESTSKSYFARESKTDASKETEEMNAKAILDAISEQLIDQVFASSTKLKPTSLVEFIKQLVAVSNAEIEGELKQGITGVASTMNGSGHGGNDGPSTFSMQKLVEVADFNMNSDRGRVVWVQMWGIMSEFFSKTGCHRNLNVSVFAVNSLKQLGMKFLEQPELAEFHFQRLFLKPFLNITENPETTQDIREMILACVDQMINARAQNLQSGWKIFFDILTVSACDPVDKISLHALSILQQTLDRHLDQLTVLTKKEDHGESKDAKELSSHERKSRNSNAEDFRGMCRASLTFIGTKDKESPRPIGVSMRALCHAAIYADLIGDGRVAPPVSGAQSTDPNAPGYTYDDLNEEDALEMVLWRTLFEGLADGVRSTEKSREGGMGNLIQRGSVLTLRAILLRHGNVFSNEQLKAILEQSILPAFQDAVQQDASPVSSIASESPAVSSLDFLSEPLAVPPPPDDEGLLKFEEVFRQMDKGPVRSMGQAELLLEATFTDMRNGGDGDLSQAYKFAKKDLSSSEDIEQPFPDSWISTTAPIALGTLTDISTEVIFVRGASGAELWRSTIGEVYLFWCNGEIEHWIPCEAVVRVGTAEVNRFMRQATGNLPIITNRKDASVWATAIMEFYTKLLNDSLEEEQALISKLLRWKWKAYKRSSGKDQDSGLKMKTAFGEGYLEDERNVTHDCGTDVVVETIKLDFGVLHRASTVVASPKKQLPVEEFAELDIKVNNPETPDWMKLLPALKIRCVAAHTLQQTLLSLHEDEVFPLVPRETVAALLRCLNLSRELAEDAVKNEDLAHAFQEAMFSEWDLDEDMGEEALVKISQSNNTQGSAMFFLTQTAGATNSVIRLLSVLYDYEEVFDGEDTWDRKTFAGEYLMKIMQDIFFKFAESEAKEGHRIDPNVWRTTAESGVKVAVYCTSFASVVVGLLKAMLSFEPSHIERNKAAFYPMVCELINVQSDEIRKLVRQILIEKFGPLLGLRQQTGRSTSLRESLTSSDFR